MRRPGGGQRSTHHRQPGPGSRRRGGRFEGVALTCCWNVHRRPTFFVRFILTASSTHPSIQSTTAIRGGGLDGWMGGGGGQDETHKERGPAVHIPTAGQGHSLKPPPPPSRARAWLAVMC